MRKNIIIFNYYYFFIYRAKKNSKGYCLTKKKERVGIYKVNDGGINIFKAGASDNSHNSNVNSNSIQNENLGLSSDQNRIDFDE